MNARDLTALVHLAGFATGIVLYVMLAVMTRRQLSYVLASEDSADADRLPLFTALLGIVWNAGAMFVYAVRDFGSGTPPAWVGAIAYIALGFLPAAVVHSTRARARPGEHAWLVPLAYAGSSVAGVLHVLALAHGDMLSSAGLVLLTVTYGLVLGFLAVAERGRPGFPRTITAVALAAFAVSALHLSRHPTLVDTDAWPIELIGHHASLPLVLAILYQDYRFAFADLFLKRAMAIVALVAVVALLYATLVAPLFDPHAGTPIALDGSHVMGTGALLIAWAATALAFPWIQRQVFRFVDRIVLRRTDYRGVRSSLIDQLSERTTSHDVLGAACDFLASVLGAAKVTWHPLESGHGARHPEIALDERRSCASVTIPTAAARSYQIEIDELRGARTLLSDDLEMIEYVATTTGRRLDEIRVDAERAERVRRDDELRRLATEAELRALRAQLNPHFLFNALNTLGHLMRADPDRAIATLYRLTGLLRAVLRRTNGQFVSLREELDIVEAYLAIEQERFEERLTVSIDVPEELRVVGVPPLLLQPLVENAVKHGIAPLRQGGSVNVIVRRDAGGDGAGGQLCIVVADTGVGMHAAVAEPGESVGLASVGDRLRLYYGANAALTIRETPGGGTTVEICLPWTDHAGAGMVSVPK